MGKKVFEKGKIDNKLTIPKIDRKSENIEDGDTLNIKIESKKDELHLSAYLNVTSGGQINITKYGIVEIKKQYELRPDDEVVCEYIKKDFEKDFIDYYNIFKQLSNKHKELGFGHSPRLSEGFTENLCRYILNLYKIKGRDYDAIDNLGKKIEIKATTSERGTVTINSDVEFDYLLWMYFDLAQDKLSIYKIEYREFKSKFDVSSGRITINLYSLSKKLVKSKFLK